MKKTDITTPISNYLLNSKNERLINKQLYEFLSIRPKNMTSLQWHKFKLGKQNYCWTGSVKNWVWEGETWRVYVSKRGAYFEVLANLTLDQAVAAWNEYYLKVKQ